MMSSIETSQDLLPLGAVVLSARDGTLARLGYPIAELGVKALGVITETRSNKSLVFFPDLKVTLWLPKTEFVDVRAKARTQTPGFSELIPTILTATTPLVWWISELCKRFPLKAILGLEVGTLLDIWDGNANELARYYSGDPKIPAVYLGLGVPELLLGDWQNVEKLLGNKLIFARFLPAGMHKLEVAIFLRA